MSIATIQVTRFDGTSPIKKKVQKGVANIAFDEYHFLEVPGICGQYIIPIMVFWVNLDLLYMISPSIGAPITCHSKMVTDHIIQLSRRFFFICRVCTGSDAIKLRRNLSYHSLPINDTNNPR